MGAITELTFAGTTTPDNPSQESAAAAGTISEIGPQLHPQLPRSSLVAHVAAAGVPTPAGNAVVGGGAASGFNAISHRDQRLAGSGIYTNTQFSLEPPDQGLCVGNGFVLEVINAALRVFTTTGTAATAATATTALNQFLRLKPAITRSKPPVFGDFVSDPKCYFDSATGHWFLTALQIDLNPQTGAFGPRSHVFIAVSQTGDPTGTWSIFSIDTTDDGQNGTLNHPNCPCFGDQPLVGADANGFFVSTNEFSLVNFAFNGAQIYAMAKSGLETGSNPPVVHLDASSALVPFGGLSFSIQPASAPPGGSQAAANGGTEFFLSSLDFNATLDDRIAVWALTNTNSLNSARPSVNLAHVVISSEVYGQPPNGFQRPGGTPLGDLVHEPLELIAGNDDRMNQVVFADGKLWSAVNSVVKTPNGPTRVGIAFFVVQPLDPNGILSASVVKQGYVAVNQENVLFPSIGVNAAGKGAITFTLVGPDFFPSQAFARIDAVGGAGDVRVAGAGAGPEDGFSGYEAFGGADVARWGDYSAAVADADGSIWTAAEFIPNAPRTLLANWGTFVSRVIP